MHERNTPGRQSVLLYLTRTQERSERDVVKGVEGIQKWDDRNAYTAMFRNCEGPRESSYDNVGT
jgi:hypothetical protein